MDAEKVAPAGTTGWPSRKKISSSDWFLIVFLAADCDDHRGNRGTCVALRFNPQKFPPITKVWPKRFIILAALECRSVWHCW